ncbi:MAG: hypothetical protein CMH56_14590 [Myxococcales bacterium]|nr:hypothetical protein [Myxococcales bacterium]|tara:strand:- start:1238 stop:1594 length:357 start_codon:yes stop_codon:yes gene_type:complete
MAKQQWLGPAKALLGGGSTLALLLALNGCGETVNCENLCTRTLKCNVSFQPSDDPDRAKVLVGERTEQDSCAIGCNENQVVTVDAARCIDNVAIQDGPTCQNEMLTCLGANGTESDMP